MSNRYSDRRRIRAVVASAVITTLTVGCQHMVNPFTDELAFAPVVTTPSVDAVRAAHVEPRAPHRPHASVEVPVSSGVVTHSPLYFEDPFETTGCDDGQFAWTGEDYLYFVYGPSRFLVSIGLFPVSAAVTPPWLEMTDDGLTGGQASKREQGDASSDQSTEVSK